MNPIWLIGIGTGLYFILRKRKTQVWVPAYNEDGMSLGKQALYTGSSPVPTGWTEDEGGLWIFPNGSLIKAPQSSIQFR